MSGNDQSPSACVSQPNPQAIYPVTSFPVTSFDLNCFCHGDFGALCDLTRCWDIFHIVLRRIHDGLDSSENSRWIASDDMKRWYVLRMVRCDDV